MENNFRLQLLHAGQVFATREDALAYVDNNFKAVALEGEPAVVFYGSINAPKAMLIIGTPAEPYPKLSFIDTNVLTEELDNVESDVYATKDTVAVINEAVHAIASKCGLTWDDNKISDQITYDPDRTDELIGKTNTLSEALAAISTYVQEQFRLNHINVENTKSITLDITESPRNGKTITAKVNISTDGDSDESSFNDNILGVKADGLFVAANLQYDEEKNELRFTTSGMRNGTFRDDAYVQVVKLGKHTEYAADNVDHDVAISIDKTNYTISADAKISQNENNILQSVDGKLYVEGKAKNIRYKDATVFDGIKAVEDDLATLTKSVERIDRENFIVGDESDTIAVTATKEQGGNYRIGAKVRLDSDRSIIDADGGLKANIDMEFDGAANTITFTRGNDTKTFKLNGVDLVRDIYYNSSAKTIVIVTSAGNLTVPVEELLNEWSVANNPDSAIRLDLSSENKLSATLNVHGADGITVRQTMGDVTISAPELKNELSDLRNEVANLTNTDIATTGDLENLSEKVRELDTKLSDESTQTSTWAFNAQTKFTQITSQLTKHDEDIAQLNEKTENLTADVVTVLTDSAAMSEQVRNISQIADATSAEAAAARIDVTRLEEKATTLQTRLDNQKSLIADNKTKLQALTEGNITEHAELTAKIAENQARIATEADARNAADTLIGTEIENATSRITTLESTVNNVRLEIGTAVSDAVTNASQTLRHYTDDVVLALNNDAHNTYATKESVADLAVIVDGKVEDVILEKSEVSDRLYTLKVDGRACGTLQLPVSQILKNATYDKDNKQFVFEWSLADGTTETTYVDVEHLANSYKAGNGLLVDENNTFSINTNDAYLAVDHNGLRTVGIDAAIFSKVADGVTAAKSYVDNKHFLTEHQSLAGVEAEIATKADKSEVYTKDEIDAKSFVTTSDAYNTFVTSGVYDAHAAAAAAETESIRNNASALEAVVNGAVGAISTLESTVKRQAIRPTQTETDGIRVVASEVESGTSITASLKLNQGASNILSLNADGLSANVTLSYNKATNTLTFDNGKQVSEIALAGNTILTDSYYDADGKNIVLVVKTNGENSNVLIPAEDLFNPWEVENLSDSPIVLSKSKNSDGTDVIGASLRVSTSEGNLLAAGTSELYASNNAKDHIVNWDGIEDTSVENAIIRLKHETDKVDGIIADTEALAARCTTLETNVTRIDRTVTDLMTIVQTIRDTFANYERRITDLEYRVQNLQAAAGDSVEVVNRVSAIETLLETEQFIDYGTFGPETSESEGDTPEGEEPDSSAEEGESAEG